VSTSSFSEQRAVFCPCIVSGQAIREMLRCVLLASRATLHLLTTPFLVYISCSLRSVPASFKSSRRGRNARDPLSVCFAWQDCRLTPLPVILPACTSLSHIQTCPTTLGAVARTRELFARKRSSLSSTMSDRASVSSLPMSSMTCEERAPGWYR
jgi:hypothetical protein